VECSFIVEAKLWRNPEARRKVIGQILDYAKELSRWDYQDLQREISRATGRKGNVLYDLVKDQHPTITEAEFVDDVTRTLAKGRYLLLILGDGIREGVAGEESSHNCLHGLCLSTKPDARSSSCRR
jgi:hypothetical protein